jgi:hypothetical protein
MALKEKSPFQRGDEKELLFIPIYQLVVCRVFHNSQFAPKVFCAQKTLGANTIYLSIVRAINTKAIHFSTGGT